MTKRMVVPGDSSVGVAWAAVAAPQLADELRSIGLARGLDAVGFASSEPFAETRVVLEERRAAGLHGGMQFTYRNPARSTDPSRTMAGARSLVVGAHRYLRRPPFGGEPDDPSASGTPRPRPQGLVARYAWSDYYATLRAGLGALAVRLEADGYRAMVLADDNALVDRAVAVRAGIGWYGNNTTVLLAGRGSWFVLGAVLTDAPMPTDPPATGGCGTCRRCLPACPTGAIVAPGVLDARRCLAWLVQAPGVFPRPYRQAVGARIYGCDDCQEVCPPNRAGQRRDRPGPAAPDAMATVDVLDLLAASDEEIMARWGRWYIAQRDPRHLRRNALIVLGNTGDASDPAVVAAVVAAIAGPDPLLRIHAVWAAARLGLSDLARTLADDPDPEVRAEVDAIDSVQRRS
jgi:epoxyqueuosine reductase